jgi:hypothetical protein
MKSKSMKWTASLSIGLFFGLSTFSTNSCKKRRFNLASLRSLATPSELRGELNTTMTISGNVASAGDLVFLISANDPSVASMFTNLDLSLQPSTYGVFQTAPIKLQASLSVDRAGTENVLIDRQTVDSGEYQWALSGNYLFQKGDMIKLTVHDLPDSLIGASVYLHGSVRKMEPANTNDQMAAYGSWDSRRTFLAEKADIANKLGISDLTNDLYDLATSVSVFDQSTKGGNSYFIVDYGKSGFQNCGSVSFKSQSTADLVYLGKNQSVPLTNSDLLGIQSPYNGF